MLQIINVLFIFWHDLSFEIKSFFRLCRVLLESLIFYKICWMRKHSKAEPPLFAPFALNLLTYRLVIPSLVQSGGGVSYDL